MRIYKNYEEINKIMEIIKKYFPENLQYNSYEYQNSKQFLEYKNIRNFYKKKLDFISKIEMDLRKIFYNYQLKNYIDWDDFKCLEFKVNMHKNSPILDDDKVLIEFLGGKRRELYISISIISDYYYAYFGETFYDKTKENQEDFRSGWGFHDDLKPNNDEEKVLLDKVDFFMLNMGYKKLNNEIANYLVENIETEFKELGRANVYDCLFTDFTIFFA